MVGARPHRPCVVRHRRLGALDELAQLVGVELGVEEREVEREVELVAVLAVEGGDASRSITYVSPSRIRSGSYSSVSFRQRCRCRAPRAGSCCGRASGRSAQADARPGDRVVAELAVLHERVRDVDPEAGDAAVEPEAEDPVELVANLVAPPVQVGLLRQEVVEVVLAAALVERPCGAVEDRDPVVRRRPTYQA